MNKKSFTLIELLVAVAIIGILVSLLLPVLSKARKKARGEVCISQIKQLNYALNMFTEDNDGYFPRLTYTPNGSYWTTWWMGENGTLYNTPIAGRPLNQYLGNSTAVAECPSDYGKTIADLHGSSYEQNNGYINGAIGKGSRGGKVHAETLTDVINPSYQVSIGEQSYYWRAKNSSNNISTVKATHSDWGRLNLGFVDGHVSANIYVPISLKTTAQYTLENAP
ncbi:prepilin-type N-terminal cleavage/methylation domain-containing protein [Lentisphaera profundi]|uniref:Prepilin-type N-terminal cleavage/methylation domain-containing protein n=1 Tax=Lentisphaera profundi TaxID=1658616 RepID=A0ABY7VWS9_9BACT|nr:prepilin-type N-terminal cleavage/methylation domain-containing protein [Lentisphaera profundi]WDE96523.1 prepilin-type N-terminal cleavage/methylation domain-containing protein [Lentisphaera profundi]